jgi:tRNA threonylcarbamoyladenosine biosynthesis protein TsaB
LLAIDTAGLSGGVALAEGRELLVWRDWAEPRRQSSLLWPAIEALLVERGLTLNDVEGVIVSIGPGRLTGVRLGLMVAKALGALKSIRFATVSTLEQIAEGWPGDQRRQTVAISLRAGRLWGAQVFSRRGGTPVPESGLLRFEQGEATSTLASTLGDAEPQFLGPGAEDLRVDLESRWPGSVPELDAENGNRGLTDLIAAGQRKILAGEVQDPRSAAPIYL